MPDSSTLGMFLMASVALLMIPGPTVMYLVARGVQQGRAAAVVSALGADLGTIILLVSTVLGMSALFISVEPAFSMMKYLGAAYLLWLGISSVRDRRPSVRANGPESPPLVPVFLQAMLVQVLNPKTVLFFVAFMPQFVDPARGAVRGQMLLLGLNFVGLAFCSHSLFAFLAGTLGDRARGGARFQAVRRTCGCIYMSLAVVVALTGSAAH